MQLKDQFLVVTYDDILRIEMSDGAHLLGYADDVVAIIVAWNAEEAKTKSWLEDKGLKLAMEKTVLIFLTRKCIDFGNRLSSYLAGLWPISVLLQRTDAA